MNRTASLLLGVLMPVTVLLLVPGFLYGRLRGWDTRWAEGPGPWTALAPGVLLALVGSALILWTTRLFWRARGTPAPWHPPRRLVIRGPYRHVRNPMILGVLLVLAGEALLAGSVLIGLWMVFFWGYYHLMLLAWEEPDLRDRFGDRFRRYCERVPRWIPRVSPVDPEAIGGASPARGGSS